MKSVATGKYAEEKATQYLTSIGYQIVSRNWRTPKCEIDIIAEKNNTIYFVEVKYRASDIWGGGLDYITPRKLSQMKYAAEVWVQDQKWTGDYRLAAIEVSGDNFEVTAFIDDL